MIVWAIGRQKKTFLGAKPRRTLCRILINEKILNIFNGKSTSVSQFPMARFWKNILMIQEDKAVLSLAIHKTDQFTLSVVIHL